MQVSLPFVPATGDMVSPDYMHALVDGAFVFDIDLNSFESYGTSFRPEAETGYTAPIFYRSMTHSLANYPGLQVQSLNGGPRNVMRPGLYGTARVAAFDTNLRPGAVVSLCRCVDMRATNVSGPFVPILPICYDVGYNCTGNITGASAYMAWDAAPLGVVQATVASGVSTLASVCWGGLTPVRVRLRCPYPNASTEFVSLGIDIAEGRGIATDASYMYVSASSTVLKLTKFPPHTQVASVSVESPAGLAVNDDYLWVALPGAERVRRYTKDLSAYTNSPTVSTTPTDLFLAHGGLYVMAKEPGAIYRLNPETLQIEGGAVTYGNADNQIVGPRGMAFDPHRDCVFVAARTSAGTQYIKRFNFGPNFDLSYAGTWTMAGKWAWDNGDTFNHIRSDGQYLYVLRVSSTYLFRMDLDTMALDHSWTLPWSAQTLTYDPDRGRVLILRSGSGATYAALPLKNHVWPGDVLIYRGHRASRPDVYALNLSFVDNPSAIWRALPGTVCGHALEAVSSATGPAVFTIRGWWYVCGQACRIPASGKMR